MTAQKATPFSCMALTSSLVSSSPGGVVTVMFFGIFGYDPKDAEGR